MKYKGSCHCGKIAFEVEGEITEALSAIVQSAHAEGRCYGLCHAIS